MISSLAPCLEVATSLPELNPIQGAKRLERLPELPNPNRKAFRDISDDYGGVLQKLWRQQGAITSSLQAA